MIAHNDNMYCGAIRRGDIVLCIDSQSKEDYFVVLQDDILNQSLPTIICSRIEKYKKGEQIFVNEVLLSKEETGIGREGVCFLHKVETIVRTRVLSKKGELKAERIQELLHALDITLGRFRD